MTSISTDSTIAGPAAAAGTTQTVTNTGTMNVSGSLRFLSDATFFNAGGLINMQTLPTVTTDVTSLNVNVGAGAASNTYTPGLAYNFVGGVNSRLGLDTFVGAVSSTGANVPSDRLLISGTATSKTNILLNDTNPGSGAYNPTGITLVGVNGASSNAFTLNSLTCNGGACSGEVLYKADGGLAGGPMGAIQKGFWKYYLLQSHSAATHDGLTGPNSSEYRLYGLPGVEAFQLAVATEGLQNIFFDTALEWEDRQDDLRRWLRATQNRLAGAAGGGADMPVKAVQAAPGYAASTGPGVWLKATGNWINRNSTQNLSDLVSAAAVLPAVNVSYDQDIYSLQGGVDFGREGVFSPADAGVVGITGGYIDSNLRFKDLPNSFKYTGGTVGVYGTYLNRGFFADALFKADFLTLKMDLNTLGVVGFSGSSVHANNLGGLGHVGYRFDWGRWYFEPRGTLAYVRSDIGDFTALGTTVSFNNGESFRGAAGARFGGVLMRSGPYVLDASVTGQYWDQFSHKNGVVFASTGPSLTLYPNDLKGYGEVDGTLNLDNIGVGWSGFVKGGAKFNSDFKDYTARGGFRYQW